MQFQITFFVRFEIFRAGTLKNAVFLDATSCGTFKNWQLLATAKFSSSVILSILMTKVIRSYETSVLTRFTRRHIPEDCFLLSNNFGLVRILE
jgi:hypothetical protein